LRVALPLRRQIVYLNLAILIPVFAVMAWSANRTYREQIRQIEEESRAMTATIVVYLERGLDIPAVQTIISTIPLPEGSVITITDDRAVVLARSRDAEQYVGRPIEPSLPFEQVPPFTIRPGVDGVERVFTNALYAGGPWLVSVGIPMEVALRRVMPIFRRNLGIAVGAMLFAFLLEFLMLRPYMTVLDRATQLAMRVASGDLSSLKAIRMPSLEMERLQRSFIDMVNKLRDAREAVAAQVHEERHMREELESLQRQVIRQERLAAIGVLVSGVAHELNNPLQAILGFAELLQLRSDLPAHIRSDLALIQKESARASAIIRNLSRFSRQQTAEPSAVRLRDVLASVVELRQRKLEEQDIKFDVMEQADITVMAIFAELQQVVLNFVINAEQAVMETPPPRRIAIHVMSNNGWARLEVQDSGPGVPPEHEPKLFQPFFTTKPVGEGTGLGLSVSYGIIQSHGGSIGYQRAPGGGAQFYFELPVIESGARQPVVKQ